MPKNDITPVEIFGNLLNQLKKTAPPVGKAALNGKSPNKNLKRSWRILNEAGIQLERSNLNYHWRQIHSADPKLGHAIEEVLVFGESLFSAWGKLTSPESLSEDYIELKQRFSKIIKETAGIVSPEEEKKSGLLSFFSSNEKPKDEPMELKLDNLDELLEEAHFKSRKLLQKAEVDLASEKAFHRAIEWYVLALEGAKRNLDKLTHSPNASRVSKDVFIDLQNALLTTTTTTTASLSSAENVLRKKEELHNQSIMFLTAHENTFTVIQGHLRSWKNIKLQTDALNSLSQTVNAGMQIMDSTSVGVEQGMKGWDYSLVTPEAMKKLAQSFGQYDDRVTALVSELTDKNIAVEQSGKFSRWEDWANVKKNLLEEILAKEPDEKLEEKEVGSSRPTLRKIVDKQENKQEQQEIEQDDSNLIGALLKDLKEKNLDEKVEIPVLSEVKDFGEPKNWTRLDNIVAGRAIDKYNAIYKANLSKEILSSRGWTAVDVVSHLDPPLQINPDVGLKRLSYVVRNLIDKEVQNGSSNIDFQSLSNLKIMNFGTDNWASYLQDMSSTLDDLHWASFMQWNELVYDLLICESDPDQKKSVLEGANESDMDVRQGLVNRISDFIKSPGLPKDIIQRWGMTGLITRYAIALDMGESKVDKLWSYWNNEEQPVDWDGSLVRDWPELYSVDMKTQTAKDIWKSKYMDDALSKITINTKSASTNRVFSGIIRKDIDLSDNAFLKGEDLIKNLDARKSKNDSKSKKESMSP